MSGVVHHLVPNEWTDTPDSADAVYTRSERAYRCLNCGDTYDQIVKQPSCKMPLIQEVEDLAKLARANLSESLMGEKNPQMAETVVWGAIEAMMRKRKWQKWKREWGKQLWLAWSRWQAALAKQPWSGKTLEQFVAEQKAIVRRTKWPQSKCPKCSAEPGKPCKRGGGVSPVFNGKWHPERPSVGGAPAPAGTTAATRNGTTTGKANPWAGMTFLTKAMKRRKRLGLPPVGYVASATPTDAP